VAVPSKAQVCCRSIAEIVGSNPAEVMNVLLLCLLCWQWSLGRDDHSLDYLKIGGGGNHALVGIKPTVLQLLD
jgi:hypothetical protein